MNRNVRSNILMSLRKLNSKYNYYKIEAEIGSYHNPYEYHEEMMEILNSCKGIRHNSDEWNEWETKIHDVGMEFWDM